MTNAASPCSDFYVIFARGSGQGFNDIDHQSFSNAIKDIFNRLDGLTYSYYQLGESNRYGAQYPAIGIEQPKIISGAILSGGQSFEFGQSIQTGMQELKISTIEYLQVARTLVLFSPATRRAPW